jgi:Ulp1 family protease
VLHEAILAKCNNVQLSNDNLEIFLKREWLNDQCINFYWSYLRQQEFAGTDLDKVRYIL